MMSFMICILQQILLFDQIKEDGLGWACIHMGISALCTRFCLESVKEGDYVEDLRTNGRIILKSILNGMTGPGVNSFGYR